MRRSRSNIAGSTKVESLALRTRAFTVFETIASITTIVLFLGAILGLGTKKGSALWQLALVVWMCIITTGLIALLFVQERRSKRRFAYSISLQSLHQVLHELRDAEAAILRHNAQQPELLEKIGVMLQSASQVFATVTGHPFRACIKQVHYLSPDDGPASSAGENPGLLRNLRVSTMVRDSTTGPKQGDDEYHFVDQNTDFELPFLRPYDHRWFCSNDLESLDTYKSSSWGAGKPKNYLAAAVWPIQKSGVPGGDAQEVLGFFCVDTMSKDAFDPRFDFYLGAAIADALYPLLKLMFIQKMGGNPSECPA